MNKEDKFKQFKAVDEACQAFLHELEQGKEVKLFAPLPLNKHHSECLGVSPPPTFKKESDE